MAGKQSPAMVAAQTAEAQGSSSRKRRTGAKSHQKKARSNAAAAETWATSAAACGSVAAVAAGTPEGAPTLPGALPEELEESRGRASSPEATPREHEAMAVPEEAHALEELEESRRCGSPPGAPPREAEAALTEKEAHNSDGEVLPSLELCAAGEEAPATQYFDLTTNIIAVDAPVSQCNSPPLDEGEPMPEYYDLSTPVEEEQDGALLVSPLRLGATTEEEQEEEEDEGKSTPLLDDIDVTVAAVETPALGPTPPEKQLGVCMPSNSADEDAEADSHSEDTRRDSETDDAQSDGERRRGDDEREPEASSEAGKKLSLAAGAGPTVALPALSFDLIELNREAEPLSTPRMRRKEAPFGFGEKAQKPCVPTGEPGLKGEPVCSHPLEKLHAALAVAALPKPDPEDPVLSARQPAGGDAHEQAVPDKAAAAGAPWSPGPPMPGRARSGCCGSLEAMRVGDEEWSLKDIFALPSAREMWQGSDWHKFSLTAVLADWSAEMAGCVAGSLREEDQEMWQPAQPECLPRTVPTLT